MDKTGQNVLLVGLGVVLGLGAALLPSVMGDRAHEYVFVNVGAVKLHIHWGDASDPASGDNFDLAPGAAACMMYFSTTPPIEISAPGKPIVRLDVGPYAASHSIGDNFYHVLPIDQTGKVYDLTDINEVNAAKRGL